MIDMHPKFLRVGVLRDPRGILGVVMIEMFVLFHAGIVSAARDTYVCEISRIQGELPVNETSEPERKNRTVWIRSGPRLLPHQACASHLLLIGCLVSHHILPRLEVHALLRIMATLGLRDLSKLAAPSGLLLQPTLLPRVGHRDR